MFPPKNKPPASSFNIPSPSQLAEANNVKKQRIFDETKQRIVEYTMRQLSNFDGKDITVSYYSEEFDNCEAIDAAVKVFQDKQWQVVKKGKTSNTYTFGLNTPAI